MLLASANPAHREAGAVRTNWEILRMFNVWYVLLHYLPVVLSATSVPSFVQDYAFQGKINEASSC